MQIDYKDIEAEKPFYILHKDPKKVVLVERADG